jgi:hypothetical protein
MTHLPTARVVARVLGEVLRDAEAAGDLRVGVSVFLLRDALAHLRAIAARAEPPGAPGTTTGPCPMIRG